MRNITRWMLDTEVKVFHESISHFMKWPWNCISWNALKEKLDSVSLPLRKVAWKKMYPPPYDHMSAVVETSFFRPKNVGFLNSKLWRAADANQIVNWLRPRLIYWKITHFGHCNYVVLSWGGLIFTPSSFQIFTHFISRKDDDMDIENLTKVLPEVDFPVHGVILKVMK